MKPTDARSIIQRILRPCFRWGARQSIMVVCPQDCKIQIIPTIAHELGHFFHLKTLVPPSFWKTIPVCPTDEDELVYKIGWLPWEKQVENEIQARAVNLLVERRFHSVQPLTDWKVRDKELAELQMKYPETQAIAKKIIRILWKNGLLSDETPINLAQPSL